MTPEQRDVVDRIKRGLPQRHMTPTEIAAVVERVRATQPVHRYRGARSGAKREQGEAAARACRDEGITAAQAAERYGISPFTVHNYFRKLYPGVSRRRGTPRGVRMDSRSAQAAVIAHDEQITFIEAGTRFGITREAVRLAHRRLYPNERRRPGPRAELVSPSLKRLAWAYGCAKKGSAEERQLREQIIAKAKAEP